MFSKKAISRQSYTDMTDSIFAIRDELKRRNPIFVNHYVDYLDIAISAMRKLADIEKKRSTDEVGPFVRKR